jgi:hypothetical protein
MELARALCSICQQCGCNDSILDSKVTKSTGLSCIVTYGVKNQHVSGMQSPLIKYVLFTGDITIVKVSGLFASDYVTMMAAVFSMLEQDVHMQVVHPCFVPFGLAPCYFLQTLSLC